MKTPGLMLLRWAAEADAQLSGMNCRRILAFPGSSVLAIHFTGRRDRFLLLPAGAVPNLCFFKDKKELEGILGQREPTEKLNRLPGRRLARICGHSGDRKITLHFAPRPDKPGDRELRLVLQLMGPQPLGLLLDTEGIILETDHPAKRYPAGKPYDPPSPPKLANPNTITFPEFLHLWRESEVGLLADLLCHRIWGIDEELATALISFADGQELQPDEPDRRQWEMFRMLKLKTRSFLHPETPLAMDSENLKIADWGGDKDSPTADSLNGLFCARLAGFLREKKHDRTREIWRKFAAAHLKKIKAAARHLAARQKEAEMAETYKQCADVLNIHRGRLRKGLSSVELPNPYEEGRTLTIELDPAKSPQGNIERYYKKHRRALSGRTAMGEESSRLAIAERLVQEIADYVKDFDPEETPYPTEEWRRRLLEMGLNPPQESGPPPKKAARRRLPYREFTLEGGEVIWVGRSARENDELTLRRAAKTDWFLHARQNAGAHVILKNTSGSAPPATTALRRAAAAAAFFSEAKHSSVVPVAYTAIKYVRKPRKASPGLVTLIREETMLVEPSPPPRYHRPANSH